MSELRHRPALAIWLGLDNLAIRAHCARSRSWIAEHASDG
jgi:hypothetical protein